MAKISILCPSFNHQRFIAEHIKSVLNQSFKDFELIIVDDCSTDDNVAQIDKFSDPRIKLIRHEFNFRNCAKGVPNSFLFFSLKSFPKAA